MNTSHLEDFFAESNPLISDVVVYHLRVESLLEMILKKQATDLSVKKIEKMTFNMKAKEVHDRGFIKWTLYEVIQKLNRLRNRYVHDINHDPAFEDVHQIVIEAGAAGVDFFDGIDAHGPAYAKSLSYDKYMLMNTLFRNVFFDLAWAQSEEFWSEILA